MATVVMLAIATLVVAPVAFAVGAIWARDAWIRDRRLDIEPALRRRS